MRKGNNTAKIETHVPNSPFADAEDPRISRKRRAITKNPTIKMPEKIEGK